MRISGRGCLVDVSNFSSWNARSCCRTTWNSLGEKDNNSGRGGGDSEPESFNLWSGRFLPVWPSAAARLSYKRKCKMYEFLKST